MSKGVFTRMKRLRFLTETEFIAASSFSGVGPNTPFPVKVTVDQLAEILYQVRRSEITAGEIVFGSGKIELTETPSPENLWYVSEDEKSYGFRAYAFPESDSGLPFEVNPAPSSSGNFFTNDYSISYGGDSEIEVYEGENEYAIWHPVFAGSYPNFAGGALATGLTNTVVVGSVLDSGDNSMVVPGDFYGLGYSGYAFDGADGYEPGMAGFEVTFSNVAVFRDLDMSGNPFSPSNEIYLGVDVSLTAFLDPYGTFDVYSARSWESGSGWDFVFNLVIELKDSTVIIPIYSQDEPESVTDIVLTATEWWPYAKDSPAVPVWDADTGLKL